MTKRVRAHQPKTLPAVQLPWGKANRARGRRYHGYAVAFVQCFAVGSEFPVADFDAWVEVMEICKVPRQTTPPSNAWITWVSQERRRIKERLNRAGSHPRMFESGVTPFAIAVVSLNTWTVKTPEAEVGNPARSRKIIQLGAHKQKEVRYLLEAHDWTQETEAVRKVANSLWQNLENSRKASEQIWETLGKNTMSLVEGLIGLLHTEQPRRLPPPRGAAEPGDQRALVSPKKAQKA